jgi:hypothetical protein
MLFLVQFSHDEAVFLVEADDEVAATARFLENRKKAGAWPAMLEEAADQGDDVEALVWARPVVLDDGVAMLPVGEA